MRKGLTFVLRWVSSARTHITGNPVDSVGALVLLILSAWLRRGGWNPGSLWLDDAWVVAGVRAETFAELSATFATTPGFTTIEVGLFALFGRASWAAQLLPFVAGSALATCAYLLVRWLGVGRSAAALGAAVAVVSPIHLIYSTRAKQYTVDALVGLVVLVLVIKALERPRWMWTAVGVALAGMVVSTTSAVLTGPAIGAGAMVALSNRNNARRWLTAAAAAGAGMGAWWLAYVRTSVPETMFQHWAPAFIDPGNSASDLATDTARRLSLVTDSLIGGGVLALALVGLSLVLLLVRRTSRGWVLVLPVIVSVGASAAQRLPLGDDRTDVFLVGIVILAVALATHEVSKHRVGSVATAALAVVVLVAGIISWKPVFYPNHDVRAFVEQAESSREPGTVIVVYPATRVAYPLYSTAPVRIQRSDTEQNGFATIIEDPTIVVLSPHRDDPAAYRPELEAAIGDDQEAWFVASHFRDDIEEIITWAYEAGFTGEEQVAPTAKLFHWVRTG